jgi:hypothetical protein
MLKNFIKLTHNDLSKKLADSTIMYSPFMKDCLLDLSNEDLLNTISSHDALNNMHLAEPIRLYLYNNIETYDVFMIDKRDLSQIADKQNIIFRDLSDLSVRAICNLLRQLYVLEQRNINPNEDLLKLLIESNRSYEHIVSPVFIVCLDKSSSSSISGLKTFYQIKSRFSLSLFLCSQNFKFLHYQDLDRFVSFMKSTKADVVKSVQMFNKILKMMLDLETKDYPTYYRIMLFSGFVLHALGTTYTTDADLIYAAGGLSDRTIENTSEFLKSVPEIDHFVYTDKSYNIDYISHITTDPDDHQYFLGMKIIAVKYHLKRLYLRASPSAFVDMIMMNKINNIKITPCIPVITIDEEYVTVYNKNTLEKKLKTTQKYFKEWHNINYSIVQLKNIIRRCKDYPNDPPFYKRIKIDPITIKIESRLYDVRSHIMNTSLVNGDSTLIIDDGREYPRFYPARGTDLSVTIIEPDTTDSDTFISMLENKKKTNPNANTLNRYSIVKGDIWRDWYLFGNDQIGEFDNIFVNYSLRFLKKDVRTLKQNLIKHHKKGGSLLVIYIDYDSVMNLLQKRDRFEIQDEDKKTIFGLYTYDPDRDMSGDTYNQFIVYLRETYRYGIGSVEPTIRSSDIDIMFDDYDVSTNKRLLEIFKHSDKLTEIEKTVIGIFNFAVLKKR